VVPSRPEEAFRLFTAGIGEWWPLEEGYSYAGDRASEIHLEPRVDGRFYERLGPDAGRIAAPFGGGWPRVLECFALRSGGEPV
jgi:hypothetical protein